MDVLTERVSRMDTDDDSNTLYLNRDYIRTDDVKFITSIFVKYKQVYKTFDETEPIQDSETVYWKMMYNRQVYVLEYVVGIEKSYFNFYSTIEPKDDPNEFFDRYIDKLEC